MPNRCYCCWRACAPGVLAGLHCGLWPSGRAAAAHWGAAVARALCRPQVRRLHHNVAAGGCQCLPPLLSDATVQQQQQQQKGRTAAEHDACHKAGVMLHAASVGAGGLAARCCWKQIPMLSRRLQCLQRGLVGGSSPVPPGLAAPGTATGPAAGPAGVCPGRKRVGAAAHDHVAPHGGTAPAGRAVCQAFAHAAAVETGPN